MYLRRYMTYKSYLSHTLATWKGNSHMPSRGHKTEQQFPLILTCPSYNSYSPSNLHFQMCCRFLCMWNIHKNTKSFMSFVGALQKKKKHQAQIKISHKIQIHNGNSKINLHYLRTIYDWAPTGNYPWWNLIKPFNLTSERYYKAKH